MLKALFVIEIFTFLFLLFGYIEKRLDKTNFKIYGVTDWKANNCNSRITQHLKKTIRQ